RRSGSVARRSRTRSHKSTKPRHPWKWAPTPSAGARTRPTVLSLTSAGERASTGPGTARQAEMGPWTQVLARLGLCETNSPARRDRRRTGGGRHGTRAEVTPGAPAQFASLPVHPSAWLSQNHSRWHRKVAVSL